MASMPAIPCPDTIKAAYDGAEKTGWISWNSHTTFLHLFLCHLLPLHTCTTLSHMYFGGDHVCRGHHVRSWTQDVNK